MAKPKWAIDFPRLGRRGAVSFVVSAGDDDELLEAILREAKRHLASRYPGIEMEAEEDGSWSGYVDAGWAPMRFTAKLKADDHG